MMVSFRAESRKCVSLRSIKSQPAFSTPLEMTNARWLQILIAKFDIVNNKSCQEKKTL
jgi:hypothetical protein